MFDRTIRSRADSLTFVNEDGHCWAVYHDWRFRIEGDEDKKVFFCRPDGSIVRWSSIWETGLIDYTKNYQGRLNKVIRESMGFIDEKIREQAVWPNC